MGDGRVEVLEEPTAPEPPPLSWTPELVDYPPPVAAYLSRWRDDVRQSVDAALARDLEEAPLP